MTGAVAVSDDILFARHGSAGVVTLNRPNALNALTHAMVLALRAHLDAWADDSAIDRVIVTAAGARAFCAGGDIRALYDLGRAGQYDAALAFWRDEYALDAVVRHYPKPYVSLIDGIDMGGGVGISINGATRVAGDRFQFAMPEVGIGLFPDVGATWFLPRLPGALGTFCALTGERFGPADAIAAGIATHRVASARFADLRAALCGQESVEAVLAHFAEPAGEGPLASRRAAIARLFVADSVEAILARLDAETGPEAGWVQALARTIRTKSPTSLKIAVEQMRRGPHLSFSDALRTEFRLVSRLVYDSDFYEGVRAVIIDKDNASRWCPDRLADVGDADIARHFAPLSTELALP